MAIQFPDISPVALSLGSLDVRWYALAYLAGFLLGWRYCLYLAAKAGEGMRPSADDIDDFLSWAVVGVILGGRLGYVLFYQPALYLADPLEVLKIWHGGMSFHGGVLGVMASMVLFSRFRKVLLFRLSDIVCAAAPIGLFFGRTANFINAELYGRISDAPWAVVFPGQMQARHPSQVYEALSEGALLFLILFILIRKGALQNRPGLVSGVFLICYGVFRGAVEFVREPDAYLGLFAGWISMGQILCLPMILGGAVLVVYSSCKARVL
jgi:phosphatidylglycerol:prolipoprotein diacylglycerol transferase